ncbi:succinylglutamate desuccinylase/aspartoacylase domain-containing protein [Alteromonas oceanisediminis]|uniref:succinylglutamate desuccinylase/aspartoacylase domain-containing protein n=1 Tax=Alteromonas oceanisediminis TaxID=2836180 RepID=UPI001BDB41FD|nr:succinylglutamate desuccinylase/aspartoacylase family protein [Alteromonas oceanisediminis]MBT0587343.1 succinylglutamate desuccinylase/aspartoacylase family protein [Alteromonas oceanisediminis]
MINEFHKDYLVVAKNASGRSMQVPVYRFIGKQHGPVVYIQSSIHGAEVQGNVVIYHLIQLLKSLPIRGEIILVPNCNPVGTNIKAGEYTLGRFDPVNGTNWNRGYFYDRDAVLKFARTVGAEESIQSIKQRFRAHLLQGLQRRMSNDWGLGLANQLNLKLQLVAANADIVLDLHNGPVSSRHLYVPEYAEAAATHFNIPHIIYIPNTFAGALDEATFCPWWTLSESLSKKHQRQFDFGVEAFTVEMGSQEVVNFSEGEEDAQGILSYLNSRNVLIDAHVTPKKMPRYATELANYKTLFTQMGGIVEYCAKPGTPVKQGDCLAKVLNVDELENERAVELISAPCDLIPILHFPSASVLSGTQLYKCFTEYRQVT